MRTIPQFETQRLRLRAFTIDDFETYAAICANPAVMRFIGTGQTLTREQAWRQLATILGHWSLRGYGLWAVEEKSSGDLIGRIGLWNPEGWPGCEVGWLLRQRSWNQGLAKEGAIAAIQYAARTLELTQLVSVIHPENQASIGLAESLGATYAKTILLLGRSAVIYRHNLSPYQSGTTVSTMV